MATSTISDRHDAITRHPRSEEWINTLTHAAGVGLAIIGGVMLLLRAGETGSWVRIAGCAIYAAALVGVYAASTLSHFFEEPRLRTLFRVLDQAFIYLLIVGSYTPMALVYLHGGALSVLFVAMWLVALAGFLSKIWFRHRIEGISTTLYVVLGWMPIFGIYGWSVLPTPAIVLLVAGGLCYTSGLLFLLLDTRIRYFHAVWHLFVIAGSVCHYLTTYHYVVGAEGLPY